MQYRLKLEMNISNDPSPEWQVVSGRIFETDSSEEEIDDAIRALEHRFSK